MYVYLIRYLGLRRGLGGRGLAIGTLFGSLAALSLVGCGASSAGGSSGAAGTGGSTSSGAGGTASVGAGGSAGSAASGGHGGGTSSGAAGTTSGGRGGGAPGGAGGTAAGGSQGGSTGAVTGAGGTGAGAAGAGGLMASQPLSANIVVDQFGYRTAAEKIAVIRKPQTGFDAPATFTPGAKYALVDAHSGQKLLEAAPAVWNSGAVDTSSGDKAWWFDFSSVTTASDYFVLDESNAVRSDVFTISDTVYRDVLTQAERMLFYQRDGFAKTAQYAGADWVDGAAHLGQCYLYSDTTMTLNKDLHGGWWDAGDFNKYTNWGASDVIELLHAYAESPAAFTDATNIPESGNGVADLLDEVKWELDWLVRMQQSNGSVLSIVGEAAAPSPSFGNPPNTAPSLVTTPCAYGPASTSASLTAAAAYAYASVVLGAAAGFNAAYPGYAAGLVTRAQQAWTWAQANPAVFFYNASASPTVGSGEQEVPTGDPDRSYALLVKRLQAELYLFEATGDATARAFFDANYASINFVGEKYIDGSHGEEQETLLEYALAPNATATVVQKIKAAYLAALQSSQNLGAVQTPPDPYLAYLPQYFWGSNQIKSDQGNLLYDVVTFAVDAGTSAEAAKGAERYIHYIHGVNPLQMVYLSNMGASGAIKSVTRFFHSWYATGSYWDAFGVSMYGPPPGYLTGGPNPSYTWDGCCPNGCSGTSCGAAPLSPPTGQPDQKSYADFNDGWPLDSWSVTEPDDGYQAKYLRLLSKFVR
ncbi:MAG TPA: glycoside hydrolase family 9 protein [Polyangia bacterium]|nr:glycoside hydrolase family 9 protein [Polyangia bacterium]